MTCILTDEQMRQVELDWQGNGWPSASILREMIANAAARKALEMAARECEVSMDTVRLQCGEFSRETARDLRAIMAGRAAAIRELAKRCE